MIRRKIWATATCCLALAGAARAQTGSTLPGIQNSQSPRFIPRNYQAPNTPAYGTPPTNLGATPPANLGAVSSGTAAAPAEMFAVEAETPGIAPAPAGPMGPPTSPMAGGTLIPMPGPTMAAPMGAPVVDATVQMPGGMPFGGMYGGAAMGAPMMAGPMMPGPALNGGPIEEAPFLSGTGFHGGADQPCVWTTGDYLNWRLKAMSVPALVTTAPAGSGGTLSDGDTTVVAGGGKMLENWQSGFRVRGGIWLPDGVSGFDLSFFNIDVSSERHSFASGGGQGLFRPFFNTAIGAEDAQLVAFSDPIAGPLLAGTVSTVAQSELWGGEANYRTGWGTALGGQLDALIGYRYVQLHDRLTIDSRSTTLAAVGTAPAGTLLATSDRFDTTNQFHGAQIGFTGEWQLAGLSLGLRGTIAGGWTLQSVDIAGSTSSLTPAGSTLTLPGGLFTQTSNIGNHTQSVFSIVPEAGATLGYQVTNNIRVFGGYNILYWTNVARASQQISRQVNATYIADPVTGASAPAGVPAPLFRNNSQTFYVQGYSVGVEFRW
jgi:hypothetical protein